MVKIAVVRVFPSRKAWICQMPDTNLAICSIFSSSDSRLPIGSGFLLCRFSLTEILVEGREVLLMMIHRCNALLMVCKVTTLFWENQCFGSKNAILSILSHLCAPKHQYFLEKVPFNDTTFRIIHYLCIWVGAAWKDLLRWRLNII